MKENKKKNVIKSLKIAIIIIIILLFIGIPVFGRYIYNSIKDAYLDSKEFYFTSDTLTVNSPTYSLTNWGGNGEYNFEINIYSQKNILNRVKYDLNYTLTCEIKNSTKVRCTLNSTTGTSTDSNGKFTTTRKISKNNNTDQIILYVIPLEEITKQDEIEIKLTAKTSEPYAKEISATIKVSAGAISSEYVIKDNSNDRYAELVLVNSKEIATIIKLEFDPNIVRIDLNDELFNLDNLVKTLPSNSLIGWTRTLDSSGKYVKGVSFKLKGESSKKIKFYKADRRVDYTYPNLEEDSYSNINGSVVKFTFE